MSTTLFRHLRSSVLTLLGVAGLLISCSHKEAAEPSAPTQSTESAPAGDKSAVVQTKDAGVSSTNRAAAGLITLTEKDFAETVLKSPMPFLVDFWAAWCGPCRMLSPIVEELAAEHGKDIRFGKLNVDEQGAIASKYGIRAIPTLLLFKDGKVAETVVGLKSKKELAAMLSKHTARTPN
jgi:thioredoxin 1